MKKFLSMLLSALIIFALSLPTFAENYHPPRLVDEADLLTDSEESLLVAKLDEISERQQFDVAVVTVDTLEGMDPQDFADDYYDYNGFGFGDNRDGTVLLLSMEERNWQVSTCGYGIKVITDAGLEAMSDKFVPYFSDGDYYGGFEKFADLCDDYITQANTGEPYDVGNYPKEPFSFMTSFLIALAIGFIISLIAVLIMKSQLKSVKMQNSASNYTKKGSMNITESRDMFLYANVKKTARPQNNSRGGSSTHKSSSGTRHGGGGGKF